MPNILNQDEIDSLLGAMENGELNKDAAVSAEAHPHQGYPLHHTKRKITEYNFLRPNLITKDQLRNFQAIHENFAREMVSSLALFLRAQVEFNLISTEQQQYTEFISTLNTITHCVIFSASPLPGMAVIEINLSLVFGVVDMLLGGKGDADSEVRVPTEIEIAILNPFIDRIVEKLESCWKTLMDVTLKKERIESDPEYIQAAPMDAPVVVLSFEAKIGQASGVINLCYPLPMIQQVNEYLSETSGDLDAYYGKKTSEESRRQVLDSLVRVPLPLSVKLGTAKVRGKDLLELKPGDIIVLDNEVTEPVEVSISGRPLFYGRPGTLKDKIFVRLGQRVSSGDGAQAPTLNLD